MFNFEKFMTWLAEADKVTPHESKYHKETFYQHVVSVASKASEYDDRVLFIVALLHDIGKPATIKFNENKGYTFYNHQDHTELIDEFLSEDDNDRQTITDLVKYHMLPYQLKGLEPWKSYAEKQLLNLVQTHDASFISKLFALHTFDDESRYGGDIQAVVPAMRYNIYSYYDRFGDEQDLYPK